MIDRSSATSHPRKAASVESGISARAPRSPSGHAASPSDLPHRLQALCSAAGRPGRFALTGGLAAVCQLTLLLLLTDHRWPDEPANVVAFVLATQVNFALSSLITWRDRLPAQGRASLVWRRWLAYQGSTASMAVVNLLVYTLARHAVPALPASALGIVAGALGNFVLGDRLIFRARRTPTPRGPHRAAREGIA